MTKLSSNSALPMLVATSDGALVTTTGPQRIVTRMADNLLSAVHSQERGMTAQRRYRIGDYEFREADFAQIQRWSRMLNMTPGEVVDRLAGSQKPMLVDFQTGACIEVCFKVVDGAIISLVWDFQLLPLSDWEWEQGLQIQCMGILNTNDEDALPRLPDCLHTLICDDFAAGPPSITVAQAPQLKKFYCAFNLLPALDLTHMPGLQTLHCDRNELNTLDLSLVPSLQELDCGDNQLTTLDLTHVSGLKKLRCSGNELTRLDLSRVPDLQILYCGYNKLTELDLTPVPSLMRLTCHSNQLATLDLTPVPGLQKLSCGGNFFSTLDLTPVPNLQELDCTGNTLRRSPLTKLDLSSVPNLKKLECGFNRLTKLDLSSVPCLQELNCMENDLITLDLTPVPNLRELYCDASVNIKAAPPKLEVHRR